MPAAVLCPTKPPARLPVAFTPPAAPHESKLEPPPVAEPTNPPTPVLPDTAPLARHPENAHALFAEPMKPPTPVESGAVTAPKTRQDENVGAALPPCTEPMKPPLPSPEDPRTATSATHPRNATVAE